MTAVGATQTPEPAKLSAPPVLKKKSFLSNFIANDFQTIKYSVFHNVIVPGIKTFVANVIYGFTNATLFKGGVAGQGNYWNYYNGGKVANTGNSIWGSNYQWQQLKPQGIGQPAPSTPTMTSLNDYKTIEFNSIDDAQEIFSRLCKRIAEYQKASVRYLYDECRLSTNDVTLDNWGWYDLNCGFQVTPLANGRYHLNLPDPVNFNVNR